MNQAELLKKFRDFTAASLDWCVKEAEEGTGRVMGAIDVLLKDISRVSLMSTDSLKALESLKGLLQSFDRSNYEQLHKSLATLSHEHSDIDSTIQPIMEALQFQDRFRQNLENAFKMIDVWQVKRQVFDQVSPSSGVLADLGHGLMAVTTMKRERDVIRGKIAGLPPEAETARVSFF
ncbi:MAG: hypothetical protein H7249_09980 [Chitinophagaceae bacterium]|nr:hypothetical protein [Oligoflexus sp.]